MLMLEDLKKRVRYWWYLRRLSKNPERAMRMLQDLLHPPKISWNLSRNEKIILDRHVAKFVASREIDYEAMDETSEEYHPNLYKLTCALRGITEHRQTWAAYDWMLDQYPDLEKLTEELGELED